MQREIVSNRRGVGFAAISVIAGLVTVAAAGAVTHPASASQSAEAAKAGIAATSEQVGRAEYLASCASCHGPDLGGGPFGDPLRGDGFEMTWTMAGKDALIQYISETMPPADPGGLPRSDYAKIADLIWSENGMPEEAGAQNADAANAAPESELRGEFGQSTWAPKSNKDAVYQKVIEERASKLASVEPVGEATLREPPAEDWLQWRRTDDAQGFSPLDQIDRSNVAQLSLAWVKPLPTGTNSITPLVRDGVMFVHSDDSVLAVDVENGDTLWEYKREIELAQFGPPISQARWMAIYENMLYVPTLDNHMLALDIHSGNLVWDQVVEEKPGFIRLSGGPIVVRGKVIQGMASCVTLQEPRRCYIVALDAKTGSEIWRFHTIPLKGEPGGDTWNDVPDERRAGGGVWSGGSYDPGTGLVYFGTGQTYHTAALITPDGKVSDANSGLYTDTTLALDPDTGKLVWHYQHMARDVWDMDWPFERTLFDGVVKGKKRRIVANMGKLGILDALDAKTGEYLFSYDVGMQNLVTAIDPETGWKTTDPALEPQPHKAVRLCPFALGVRNWPATSYDAKRDRLFVPLNDSCMEFTWDKGASMDFESNILSNPDADGMYGGFTAIDVAKRQDVWTNRYRAPMVSAVLATAGDIVFAGGRDRIFRAMDSDTGETLWEANLGRVIGGSPITFAVDGTQYVAITAGGGNPMEVLRASLTPEIEPVERGTVLWVFKLPAK